MKRHHTAIVGVSVLAAICALSWQGWSYDGQRRALISEAAALESAIASRDAKAMQIGVVRARTRAEMSGALGSTPEAAGAALRTALLSIGESHRIADVSVATQPHEAIVSPLTRTRLAEFRGRDARARVDFSAIRATLSGKATFGQAVSILSVLESQPWVQRVDSIVLRPIGKSRTQVELSVTVTGYFASDAPASPAEGLAVLPVPERTVANWSALHRRNPFVPAVSGGGGTPVVETTAAPRPSAAEQTAASYRQWRVTAIVHGKLGPEVWFVNTVSGESKTLTVGQNILEAVLVAATDDTATIRIGEQQYVVRLGQTLGERSPAIQ